MTVNIPTYASTTSLPPQSAETTTVTLTTTLCKPLFTLSTVIIKFCDYVVSVGLILTFICGLFLGACGSCVVYCSLQKWKSKSTIVIYHLLMIMMKRSCIVYTGSNHKGKEMNIAVISNPAYEIVHLTH